MKKQNSTIGECLSQAEQQAVKNVAVKIYNRKGEAFTVRHLRGNLYAMLDKHGKPTGTTINLATALDCRAYFSGPLNHRRRNKATCCV